MGLVFCLQRGNGRQDGRRVFARGAKEERALGHVFARGARGWRAFAKMIYKPPNPTPGVFLHGFGGGGFQIHAGTRMFETREDCFFFCTHISEKKEQTNLNPPSSHTTQYLEHRKYS